VQYTVMMERGKELRLEGSSPEKGKAAPRRRLAQLITGEQKLDREDWAQMTEVMRALLNAAKNIKIYPVNSKTVSSSIQQLLEAIQSILIKRHVLTLAQVSNSLVANGVKIDTTTIEPLVEGVRRFLDSIMLTSLTFLEGLSTQELKILLGALGQLPTSGMDREYWPRFAREQGLSNILLSPPSRRNL